MKVFMSLQVEWIAQGQTIFNLEINPRVLVLFLWFSYLLSFLLCVCVSCIQKRDTELTNTVEPREKQISQNNQTGINIDLGTYIDLFC